MALFTRFISDPDKQSGVWSKYRDTDIEALICPLDNPDHTKAIDREVSRMKKEMSRKAFHAATDKRQTASIKPRVLAGTVLCGFKNIQLGPGDPLPDGSSASAVTTIEYSKKTAEWLLENSQDFLYWVVDEATDSEKYNREQRKEKEGNS